MQPSAMGFLCRHRILHADSAGSTDPGGGQLAGDMGLPGDLEEDSQQLSTLPGFRHTLAVLTAQARASRKRPAAPAAQ